MFIFIFNSQPTQRHLLILFSKTKLEAFIVKAVFPCRFLTSLSWSGRRILPAVDFVA